MGIAKSTESDDPPNLSDTLALPLELNEGDSYEIVPWSSRYPTTLLLSELVFRDLGRNEERDVDDDARDVFTGIRENVVAIEAVRFPDPDGPVRVG